MNVHEQLRKEYPHGHDRYIPMTLEELALHSAKNFDYAGGGDPLGNFKRVGTLLSQYPKLDVSDPAVYCLVLGLKQLDAALCLLSRGEEGGVENVGTRLTDLAVYAKLARLLWEEQQAH